MATSSIIITTSHLLTCVALVLALLPPCTQARSFPTVGSTYNGFISMVTDLAKKTPKSPPSPKPEPSKHQATNDGPVKQASGSVLELESMVFDFGKTSRSPPSPKPAPSKRQGTIEQPTQQSSSSTPHFGLNSMVGGLGKTPRSPPSPKPAPSKGHEMIEQPMQQQTTSQDFQVASF